MARIHFVILSISILLLASCGQVGVITGGERDLVSPRIYVDKVQPPMGSLNIFPTEIIIPFDEYIALNKPAENIRVTPEDVKLDYIIKKKSLVLKVKEGSWEPNTTYTINLNRAVRDITESNDSIISYVFSTGSFLDSLQTAVQVNDAYTGKPVSNATVGLYTSPLINDTSNVKPRYYASTNKEGVAVFQNVKNATFYIYAFNDENRNNRLDATEKRAILRKPPVLATEVEVGPLIRLMPPKSNKLEIVSNEALPTAKWCLGFNRPLKEGERFEFLSPQPNKIIWNNQGDSLTAFYETTKNSGTFAGLLHTPTLKDSISKKYFFKDKPTLEIKTNLVNKQLRANDTLKLFANEPFKTFEESNVKLLGIAVGDSVKQSLPYTLISSSPLERGIYFERENQEKLFLEVLPSAIEGLNYSLADSLNLDFTLQKERETGMMMIEFDTLPAYGILYVTHKTSKEKIKIVFDGVEKINHQLKFLQPGEYTFHYLIDEDRNGRWTTGSIFEDSEAEEIIWFTATSTIRANWEVKVSLPLKITN